MRIADLPTHALHSQLVRFGERILPSGWQKASSKHTLNDGQCVMLKPIAQEDTAAIAQILADLDPESAYFRFGQYHLSRSPKRVLQISQRIVAETINGGSGWIAYCQQANGEQMAVGKGRYVPLSGGNAEVAFTVLDAYQGIGLGTLLWQKVIKRARDTKLKTVIAHVHPQNYRMQSLIHKSELPVFTDYNSQLLSMSMPLG